ncbi:hypothetical protein HID58_071596 [Brassica napus]|uniref:Uncharacterized protein n=1 Tax=Brassica napus TaxID=3708 RepID=A0ABQ7Z225_BRANA|nr:hypothetical protein HID58_094997 [Brassica napus]KAH0874234.1 hypothetical protein HID58_071596 [Brassica napus]
MILCYRSISFHISPTKVPYENFSNEQGNVTMKNLEEQWILFENNYSRAKIFINQAKSLDIDLGCLNQVLIMIDEEEKLTDISTAQRALFKLILKAWSQLYDQEGKHKNSGIQKSQKPHEPASSNKPRPKPKPEYESPPKFEPTFWKGCNRCKTYCEFLRVDYLNKS